MYKYRYTRCPDALVPSHLLILRYEYCKEAHVKQLRHPTAHVYYCCPYKSARINILHVLILCNLTLTSLFFYRSRIVVDFSMVPQQAARLSHTNRTDATEAYVMPH
jgi:hypothetical protein